MNQFWKTVVPVKGEPIPDRIQQEIAPGVWKLVPVWRRRAVPRFTAEDEKEKWRVPVECVPIEKVAELIVENRTVDHYKRLWSLNMCAKTVPELRELVLTTLRELAAESVTT